MIHELSSDGRRLASATLNQISNICDDAEEFCYKDHPLLQTQSSNCIVKISKTDERGGGISQSKLKFNFRNNSGRHMSEVESTIRNNGEVTFTASPVVSEEGRDSVLYALEIVLPEVYLDTIKQNPESHHNFETDIIATEGLTSFIYSSYLNRAKPLIVRTTS